ncbi:hypothetical protein [Bacillus sp. REN3]|uniref:hypothetical protein n=1 Tax=Bacillus sp. REN3 TaxID=2802440 RepID=UPI001AEE99E9|nr:hypothetical protein [Bacillus sp. REN3]
MKNKLMDAVVPFVITSIISMLSLTVPASFLGGVIYSFAADTRPTEGIDYIRKCIFYSLFGMIGWIVYVLAFHHQLSFQSPYIPALFSLIYYHFLLWWIQYNGNSRKS